MADTELGLEPVEDAPVGTGSLRWMIWLLVGVVAILAALAWVGSRGGARPEDAAAFGGVQGGDKPGQWSAGDLLSAAV